MQARLLQWCYVLVVVVILVAMSPSSQVDAVEPLKPVGDVLGTVSSVVAAVPTPSGVLPGDDDHLVPIKDPDSAPASSTTQSSATATSTAKAGATSMAGATSTSSGVIPSSTAAASTSPSSGGLVFTCNDGDVGSCKDTTGRGLVLGCFQTQIGFQCLPYNSTTTGWVFSRAGSPFWAGTLGDFNQTCQHVPILPTGNNTVTLTQDSHGNPVTYPPKDAQRPLDAYLGNCNEGTFYCDPTTNTCLKQKSIGEACVSTNQCEGPSVCYSSVCTDLGHNSGTSLSLASRVSVGMLVALVVLTFISLVVLIFCKPKQRGKDVEGDVGEDSQEIEMLYFARAPVGSAPTGSGNAISTSSPQATTATEESPTVTTVTVTTSTVSVITPAHPVPEIILSRPDTPDSEGGGHVVEHELTRASGAEVPPADTDTVDDSYLVEEPPPPYLA